MSENLDKNEELKKYEKLAEENRSLDKFRSSDIVKWAVKLKHDKETAKKYEGVSTVQEILKKAREDGFNFTEKELLDFNLDLVAGGAGDNNLNTGDNKGNKGIQVGGDTESQQDKSNTNNNETNLNFNAKDSSFSSINISNNNSATQG